MNDKTYKLVVLVASLVGFFMLYKVIKDGQTAFDNILGENPLNAVGGSTTDTGGWLTQWYLQTSGNADSKVWDPYGIFGAPNLGNDTLESWVDPFGWFW